MRALVVLAVLSLVVPTTSTRLAAAAQTRAFVFTTDFGTGSLSVIDLNSHAVQTDVTPDPICADSRLLFHDGLLDVIERYNCDNLHVLDPNAGFDTVHEFSTGNGSNPGDVLYFSPTRAYVTRYELSSLLIMNPTTGQTLGQISLAAFADADGTPEMDRMVRVGNRVFVSVQRLDRPNYFIPTDQSVVVVIDADADTVLDADPTVPGVQAITLTGKNPVTRFGFDRATSRLLIGCVGFYGASDGGIEWIDPVTMKSLGYAITESALGGDVTAFAWNGPAHSYAVVTDASFHGALVAWSAVSGTSLGTVYGGGSVNLADCALDDRGELYLCENTATSPAVHVFATSNDQRIAGPIATGLPPVQVVFDASAAALGVDAGESNAFTVDAPRPNPARSVVAFTFGFTRATSASIDIFDAAGRVVRRLATAPFAVGTASRTWDLRDASGEHVKPGIYFVRTSSVGKTVARRFVVMY